MSAQPNSFADGIAQTGYTPEQAWALLRAAAHTGLAPEAVAAALDEAVPDRETTPLSQPERTFLAEHAGPMPDPVRQDPSRAAVIQRVAAATEMEAGTLSVEQVADLMGRDRSRVRHQLSERYLFGYKSGHRLRLPAWQFHDRRPVPHLRQVLQALPDAAHPATVTGFMTTPSDELDGMSPTEWLISAGPASRVLALAHTLTAW